MERELAVKWQDPAPYVHEGMGMAGLEYMQAVASGRFPKPPISELMGFGVAEAEEGRCRFEGTPGEQHLNPLGVVHAGLALTMLDSAAGCAVHTTLTQGEGYTTLETKVNLVRAIRPQTGPLVCEGLVVHRGRTIATAEARLTGAEDGKLYAHGTSTCLIMSP